MTTLGPIKIRGARNFRQRVVCATLSGRSVRISEIRSLDENPGLRNFEANFLRLIDKICNGCSIEINETGTMLKYEPGVIIGGSRIHHECDNERSIGYYLEPLLSLAPFAQKSLSITLTGVTHNKLDISVDAVRTVLIPHMQQFGIEARLEVSRRGSAPEGHGSVHLSCQPVKALAPINIIDPGMVKRIRGLAYTTRVPPTVSKRAVHTCRGVFNNFIPDVWIFTDHTPSGKTDTSPGFGLTLVAESTTGCILSAEAVGSRSVTPEDLGTHAAHLLLDEIQTGACVDRASQPLVLLLMVLCPEDVSSVRFGKLPPYTIQTLRLLKEFFGVTFKLQTDKKSQTIILSCQGVGFRNYARQAA